MKNFYQKKRGIKLDKYDFICYNSVNMKDKKYFYEKNKKFIEHPVNQEFDVVLHMDDVEFRAWMREMRAFI